MKMLRTLAAAGLAVAFSFGVAVAGGDFGTADEAKAMLENAIANIKADKAKALAEMQAGGMVSRDRDLYVFCADATSGDFTVHPKLMGSKLQDVKDKNGKMLGTEMMQVAKEGSFAEVSYFWPRPGEDTTPVEKTSFVTLVEGEVCGVGFYKQ